MSDPSMLEPARQLAVELDAFIRGDKSRSRVDLIEGALSEAEPLRFVIEGFEDLELAAGLFNPGGGSEYYDAESFDGVARLVRGQIREVFAV